jgi:hypothetical protein
MMAELSLNSLQNKVNSKANSTHTHTKAEITDLPTSLPANGGNADTVGGKSINDIQSMVVGGSSGGGHQLFTASGTFIVPSGVNKVWVICVGGAGSGGGMHSSAKEAGTTGFSTMGSIVVTPGSSIAVTVGQGGAGTVNNGISGGESSFGSYLSAAGGYGGNWGYNSIGLPKVGMFSNFSVGGSGSSGTSTAGTAGFVLVQW